MVIYKRLINQLELQIIRVHVLTIFFCGKQESKTSIITSGLTDHYKILLSIELKIVKNSYKPRYITKTDHIKLKEYLDGETWQEVCGANSSDQASEKLIEVLQGHIKKATKSFKISNKQFRIKPWITQGLLISIRHRDKLKKISAKNPGNQVALYKFIQYRNYLTKLIRQAKNGYYENQLNGCINDPRKTWHIIKEVTNEAKKNCTIKTIKGSSGIDLTTPLDIANDFNEFFSGVGKKLASAFNNNKNHKPFKNTTCNKSLFFRKVNDLDILEAINSLKNTNSAGEDRVTPNILKYCNSSLVTPIKYLVNIIFDTGKFPSNLKNSVVVPIHKSGNKKDKNNYRPITITSSLTKVVEKCIKKRLTEFLDLNKIISEFQFGFKQKNSTEDAITRVVEFATESFEMGLKPLAIFLDLSKAFDTVTHQILLNRMELAGIRGKALEVFRSYLQDRTQKVRIGETLSNVKTVEFGVPQGTVLGPALFSLYVNGIFQNVDSAEIICFADDTAILVRGGSWEATYQRAETILTRIKAWFDYSMLTLNAEKSVFIPFIMNRNCMPIRDSLVVHSEQCDRKHCNCNEIIKIQNKVKYLGVYFDQFLKWDIHCEYVTGKLRKLIYKFYQLRQILSLKSIKCTYMSLVESIPSYGIVAWGAACKNVLNSISIVQKFIIKVCLFKRRLFPSDLLFKDSGFLNIRQIYLRNVLRFSAKNRVFCDSVSHNIVTRSVTFKNVTVPRYSFSLTQRQISYVAPKIFNMLPTDIKLNLSKGEVSKFKTKTINKKINYWLKDSYDRICDVLQWL